MNPLSTVRARRTCAAVLVAGIVLTGCSNAGGGDVTEPAEAGPGGDERSQAVAAALEEAGLTTFASAVADVDIDQLVEGSEFTLFAPDDEAFQGLTADELADLTSETERMAAMLRDHVVEGAISADDLAGASEVTTLSGTTLDVRTDGDAVTVGEAVVIETGGQTGDFVVHVVDALLVRE